jgi:hypothetical protein
VIAGGDPAAFGGGRVGDRGDSVGLGGPLLAPGAVGSASPARAASRCPMRSTSAMATAAYGTMPLTICMALLQRRLPGKCTAQLL